MIADHYKSVTQRIAKCCEKIGRSADDVKVVCVTKGVTVEGLEEALRLGAKIFGENRMQEALPKIRIIGNRAEWHLIGHLQTNKAKEAVSAFSLIHSVDSIRLAEEIDRQAKKIKKVQDVLIEVNTSGEKTKFGVTPESLLNIVEAVSSYNNICVKGLMAMAPEVDDPKLVRPYFRRLRELRDEANTAGSGGCRLEILSMGMSGDFEVAIEEGSNMVRVGRAIFKD